MLDPILQESVNYVNASVVARERGMQVAETWDADETDFQSLITCGARGPDGRPPFRGRHVDGTGRPTLVEIDGYRVNVDTPGHMLVACNVDRPGMIGRVGTLLGEARHQHRLHAGGPEGSGQPRCHGARESTMPIPPPGHGTAATSGILVGHAVS